MSGVDACFGLFLITWSFLTDEASAPVVMAVLPAPRRLLSALLASGAVSIGDWCAGNLTAFALATERFAIAGPSVRAGWLRGNEFAWFIPKFLVISNGACLAACLRRRF